MSEAPHVDASALERGGAAAEVSAEAWLRALLDVEAALARACAGTDLIPEDAADEIAAVCVVGGFEPVAIDATFADGGDPLAALVAQLRERVGGEAAAFVQFGASSRDVLDTAAMLVAKRALAAILDDADGAAEACAALARRHRETPAFGLRAAGWMTGIDEAWLAVSEAAERVLAVQLGGPTGTRAAWGDAGWEVAAAVAEELELVDPVLPWPDDRVRPAALAGAVALLAGALGRAGRDVLPLVRAGAAREPGGAAAVVACATRVPGLVATLHAAMLGGDERAAEWETLSDLLRLTGAAAAWARETLEGLEVEAERLGAGELDAAAAVLVDAALDARG